MANKAISKEELKQMISKYLKAQEKCNTEKDVIAQNRAVLNDFYHSWDNLIE